VYLPIEIAAHCQKTLFFINTVLISSDPIMLNISEIKKNVIINKHQHMQCATRFTTYTR